MDVSRRAAIGTLFAFAAGTASACTPLRMALQIYPGDFDDRPQRVDRILRAFATTVVPDTPPDDPDLVRAFHDDDYPLAKYRNYFVADLCKTSEKLFGTDRFERLNLAQRTRVMDHRQKSGGVTTQLYSGAILLTQITCYAGIYDDAKSNQPMSSNNLCGRRGWTGKCSTRTTTSRRRCCTSNRFRPSWFRRAGWCSPSS